MKTTALAALSIWCLQVTLGHFGLCKSSVLVSPPNVSSAEGVSGANVITVLEGGKDAEATSAYAREKCSGPKCNKNRSL